MTRPRWRRRVPVAVDERPLGRRPAVVEHRLADELDLDRALEALDGPDEHVVGVVVRRGTGVRRDDVLTAAGPIVSASRTTIQPDRRLPGGHEDVRAGSYRARSGC